MNLSAQSVELKKTSTLSYLVKEPKIKSTNPPLLILLHGIGSNEEDLFSFANRIPDNFLVVSVRAPQVINNGSYAWYDMDLSTGKPIYNKQQAEESRKTIIAFINQLKVLHPYNEHQVYLCGFSQGAVMSYSVGLTRPDIIKGIAVMSGRLLEEVKSIKASEDKLKNLKVFISHGKNDTVLPIHYAREGDAYLKSLNIFPTYNEYTEGHGINSEMLNDLIEWLKKQ